MCADGDSSGASATRTLLALNQYMQRSHAHKQNGAPGQESLRANALAYGPDRKVGIWRITRVPRDLTCTHDELRTHHAA